MTEETDILLATILLAGRAGGGQENFDYLIRGSKEDNAARKALVRVLLSDRGPPPTMLRQIAALFDPDQLKHESLSDGKSGISAWEASQRQLIFVGRTNIRKSRGFRDFRIASWMHCQRLKGVSLKEVRRCASKEFKLSDAKLKIIWNKHKSNAVRFRADLEAPYAGNPLWQAVSQFLQESFSNDLSNSAARLVSKVTK